MLNERRRRLARSHSQATWVAGCFLAPELKVYDTNEVLIYWMWCHTWWYVKVQYLFVIVLCLPCFSLRVARKEWRLGAHCCVSNKTPPLDHRWPLALTLSGPVVSPAPSPTPLHPFLHSTTVPLLFLHVSRPLGLLLKASERSHTVAGKMNQVFLPTPNTR